MDLTPDTIRAVSFRERRRGYDQAEVDAYLDRMVETVTSLESQLDEARRGSGADAGRVTDAGDGSKRAQLIEVLKDKALRSFAEPVQLRSGAWSRWFVDGKLGTAHTRDLFLAAEAMAETAAAAGVDLSAVDAVGGLTLGADALAVALARTLETSWFIVRKEAKGRGTNQLVEGFPLGPGRRVFLVDDAVTTAGSILQAHDTVTALGATVVAAATLIDRGDTAAAGFADLGVPYFPMAGYRDLEIPAVGTEAGPEEA